MDAQRFEHLANGALPSLEDYAGFVALAEALPVELLWDILTTAPEMNGLLRGVINKNLQSKVPQANVEASLDAIATAILDRTSEWKETAVLVSSKEPRTYGLKVQTVVHSPDSLNDPEA